MIIIAGLGNPGKQYEQSRHNVGFAFLDQAVKNIDSFEAFKINKRFKAQISAGKINKEDVLLVKPQDFYNNSGPVISSIINFYKVKPSHLIVIHDELDLPIGKIRIAFDSSSAGNNGVQSIIDTLKSKKFTRVRVGIKSPARTTARSGGEKKLTINSSNFVLGKFSPTEKKLLKPIADQVPDLIKDLVTHLDNLNTLQNKYN